LTRLPIRARLTVVFACSMALVLAATGGFLYLRIGTSLDHTLAETLETRSAELATAQNEGVPVSQSVLPGDQDEQFAQLLDRRGRILDATAPVRETVLLPDDVLAATLRDGAAFSSLAKVPGLRGPARLFARTVTVEGQSRVLVVGMSLAERNGAVEGLLRELLLVGPAALLLASLLGYWVASAALRPVESMSAEAAVISAAEPGRRLPLPRARDEVRRLGETLNATLERLEGALRLERTFVADASHEMRSPVARLKTELELALRRPRSAEELERTVRSASAEADVLARLSENLLLLARSDHGRLPLRPAPVRVRPLLERLAARFSGVLAQEGRRIDSSAPAELEVLADEGYLGQALSNAVENAVRHGAGTVSLLGIEGAGEIELHVLDEGPGFPGAFLPHAFSRFTRVDEARTSGGSGLGLSIIAAIAAAHGGRAHAANRAEGGADVWLSLPLRTAAP
jgi:two-component system OmpR family sensor kinase